MWETIRGYLTFTRKERFGVLFLLLLISVLFVAPYFFRPAIGTPDPVASEKYKEGIRPFESRSDDSSRESVVHDRYQNQYPANSGYDHSGGNPKQPEALAFHGAMFYFDPNTIAAGEWQRLGLSARLTQTILHYVEKGGHFRQATDLQKLYGLHPADYQRLLPYVRIPKNAGGFPARSGYQARADYSFSVIKKADSFLNNRSAHGPAGNDFVPGAGNHFPHTGKKLEPTDINLADSADWCRLPGIGAKLAMRIIHFRQKLGGFYRVDQVAETFGLPDSSFQNIKSCLQLRTAALQQIDLNTAEKETLQAHPYIRWQIAKGILDYRIQHGGFKSVEELLQLAQMDPEKFEKMKPYLKIQPNTNAR